MPGRDASFSYRTDARQRASADARRARSPWCRVVVHEVAHLVGVGTQVEQLPVVELRPLDVLPVATHDGLRRGDAFASGDGRVLVEELVAPGRRAALHVEWRQVAPLHHVRNRLARRRDDRRSHVDVQRQFLAYSATPRRRHPRVAHDERDANRFLVRIPLVGEPAIGVEVPVVADHHDERLLVDTLRLQFARELADRLVHLGDQPVVPRHVRLVALGRIEAPVEADAAFVRLIRQERRQGLQVARIAVQGWRNRHALVVARAPVLWQILLRRVVLGVRREEPHRQHERPVFRARPQELERIARVLLRDVDAAAIGSGDPVGAVVRPQEIVVFVPRPADVVLADVPGPVACPPKHARVRPGERGRGQRRAEGRDAMPRHVLSGQHRGPADHADRRRHPRLLEAHALGGEPIDVRRAHHRVAGDGYRVPADVVDDQQDDVQRRVPRTRPRPQGQRAEQQPGHRQASSARRLDHASFFVIAIRCPASRVRVASASSAVQ